MGILEVKDFSFSYPGGTLEILHNVNLSIEEGEFLVLCGTSGCGKSTLLRNLKSALAPGGEKKGEILFNGVSLEKVGQREQSAEIGYVLQNPDNQIVTDKVWHELAFGLESLGYDTSEIRLRVSEMASYFGIHDWFYRDVTELSGGQKQLLNLASIMAMHPSLLILDEPTSQLDPIAASDFLETIKKINRDMGITIIITEHRLEDIFPAADKVLVMDSGRIIAEGEPSDVGIQLMKMNHPMFQAMPAPMQIHARVESDLPCPLTVRRGREWISKLFPDKAHVTEPPLGNEQRPQLKELLEFREVWFRYEQTSRDVVKGLNLKLYEGECYCLLGGNGAGKSTALSLMCKVREPYRGKILINGVNIKRIPDREMFRGMLGVVPQNPQSLFVKKTVRDELYEMIGGPAERKSPEYDSEMKKQDAIIGFAKLVHLDHRMNYHPYDLSGGEQQRLALAKILLLKPRILLMDEPTKGMDQAFKTEFAEIMAKLKAHGVTIFMISHDIEFCARYADRCGLFFDGNIVTSNPPREFFSGNNFYTTSSNRMARHRFPNAITVKDVIKCCKTNL